MYFWHLRENEDWTIERDGGQKKCRKAWEEKESRKQETDKDINRNICVKHATNTKYTH